MLGNTIGSVQQYDNTTSSTIILQSGSETFTLTLGDSDVHGGDKIIVGALYTILG